jgi:hypothetical protein
VGEQETMVPPTVTAEDAEKAGMLSKSSAAAAIRRMEYMFFWLGRSGKTGCE